MRKLRNIGYLRFGSKIRQGFAGGITSLTAPLFLSPLWISWAGNEGAREGTQLLYLWGGACRPPARRQAPARDLRVKKNLCFFTCRSLLPPAGR